MATYYLESIYDLKRKKEYNLKAVYHLRESAGNPLKAEYDLVEGKRMWSLLARYSMPSSGADVVDNDGRVTVQIGF